MKEGIAYTGIPSAEELGSCAGIPTRERMAKGPVAVIECIQCIPCNPCEMACPTGAISLGGAISNAPKLDGRQVHRLRQVRRALPRPGHNRAEHGVQRRQGHAGLPLRVPAPARGG